VLSVSAEWLVTPQLVSEGLVSFRRLDRDWLCLYSSLIDRSCIRSWLCLLSWVVFNHSLNQSINQSMNQSITRYSNCVVRCQHYWMGNNVAMGFSQSFSRLISQPVSQSVSHCPSVGRCANRTVGWPSIGRCTNRIVGVVSCQSLVVSCRSSALWWLSIVGRWSKCYHLTMWRLLFLYHHCQLFNVLTLGEFVIVSIIYVKKWSTWFMNVVYVVS